MPERIWIEGCISKRAITRDNFFYLKKIYMMGKLLIAKHLLFLSSCDRLASPMEPQATVPFLSSGWFISLNCLTASSLASSLLWALLHM